MGEEDDGEMTESMLREGEEDGDDEFDGDEDAETDDDDEESVEPATPDPSQMRRLGYEEGDAESTPRAALRGLGVGLGLSGV
ncbi:hypothetical protein LTR01_002837 [Friedmanniomyces endolithicus]|nr:hypothetical protein LTR01_002837 [Friedmanniomyces endolithicus]KAK0832156.1 hypothetical protein LTR73_002443 [Friedmanniomyces endolithicus]